MIDPLDYTLTCRQSNSFSRVFRYRTRATPDDAYTSALLAGDELYFTITHSGGILEKTLSYDENTGEITLDLTPVETESLAAGGSAYYELELRRNSGAVQKTILAGRFIVKMGRNNGP